MKLYVDGFHFTLTHGNRAVLTCAADQPLLFVGYGEENVLMYRGNYRIEDSCSNGRR